MARFTNEKQKRLGRLVTLALIGATVSFGMTGTASAFEEHYVITDAQVHDGGPLLTWRSQTGAGTQTISDDKVVISMTAPVISASGCVNGHNTYGYSVIKTDGSAAAKFDIDGTKGVSITSIGNPVLTDDNFMRGTEDKNYKKSNVLTARDKSSITINSADGDVHLNLADEVAPANRDGSYNLIIPFYKGYSSQSNVVRVQTGSKVSLKGKNVTVSMVGKEQADGTHYYDPDVQYGYNYGFNLTEKGSSAEMIATNGNNCITMENAGTEFSYGAAVWNDCQFTAQALKGDNIFMVKPDPTREMHGYYVVRGGTGSNIKIEGINNTLQGEGTSTSSECFIVETYGDATITAEKDNNFLIKSNSTGFHTALVAGRGYHSPLTSHIYVTAKNGNNTIYVDPSSPVTMFVGVYSGGDDSVISLSAPNGENRIVADINTESAKQTLEKYGKNTNGISSNFEGIQALDDRSQILLDSQRNIVEIFPAKFGTSESSEKGTGILLGYSAPDCLISLKAQHDNIVRASSYGMDLEENGSHVNLEAVHGDNIVYGGMYGINGTAQEFVSMHTQEGNNSVTSEGTAIAAQNKCEVSMKADTGDNEVRGKEYAARAEQNGQITIESPKGTNYISAEGTAVDIMAGGTSRITVTGQSVIEGNKAALRTEKWEYSRDQDPVGGTIQVNYDGNRSITGDVYGLNEGTVNVTPQNSGKMVFTGNVYGADEQISLADFDQMPAFELKGYYGVVNKAWADLSSGGTANVELSAGSSMTGIADTGRRYAKTLLEKRKATFDEKLESALQHLHDLYFSWYEEYAGHTLTDEEKNQFEEDWNQFFLPNYKNTYNKDTMLQQFESNAADAVGEVNIKLNDGALWDMTGSSAVTTLGGTGGTVYFENGGDALEIGTLSGRQTFVMDLNAGDGSDSDMLYINEGTPDEQTLVVKNLHDLDQQMDPGDAIRFAVVSDSQNEFRNGKVVGYTTNGIYRDAFTVEYRDVASDPLNTDAYNNAYNGDTSDGVRKPTSAEVQSLYYDGYDNPQNVYLVKSIDDINDGAVTPGRARDIVWRYVTDLDTFTNRTGESQYFTPDADQGGWIRYKYRDLGVDGVGEIDGNTYEVGYTTVSRQNDERKHRFSASVAYGRESGNWEGYGGDLKVRDLSFNLYDTHEYFPSAEKMAQKPAWKQGTHSYWDNYLKYHHVKTEYSAVDHIAGTKFDGDYSQNVFNLSTEYGRENKLSEAWSWVPQAQLQLSYVGGYDYTDSQNLSVSADHDWSLIGRVGFDLVKKLDAKNDSKLYLKASLLHEFLDGYDVTTSYQNDRYTDDGDQSGTWGVFGLGYSLQSGKNQYLYFDAERYVGHDFERTYNIRAGINWKF